MYCFSRADMPLDLSCIVGSSFRKECEQSTQDMVCS